MFDRLLCFELLLCGMCHIYNSGVKHLARLVNSGHLASGAVSRIKSESSLPFDRRLEKKLTKIDIEHFQSRRNRIISQSVSCLTFNRRKNQTFICIRSGITHCISAFGTIIEKYSLIYQIMSLHRINADTDLQKPFFFASVYCENTVTGYLVYRLIIFIIHSIYTLGLTVGSPRLNNSADCEKRTKTASYISIVRNIFSNYIHSSCYGFLCSLNTVFRIYIFLCKFKRRRGICILFKNKICKRLKTLFLGD